MGEVDLRFRPSVPVFDANMALGRRHDRRVLFDSVEDALREMDRAGVERALVYSTVAATDPIGGNRWLEATLEDEPRLVPQLIGSPARDDLERFAGVHGGRQGIVDAHAARAARLSAAAVGGRGVVRVGVRRAGAGVAAGQLRCAASRRGPRLSRRVRPVGALRHAVRLPDLNVVLTEVQYAQAPSALALMKALPNLHMEISRFVSTDGVAKLLRIAGETRVLFGSRFPDSPLAAQLYHLHRYGLPESRWSTRPWRLPSPSLCNRGHG